MKKKAADAAARHERVRGLQEDLATALGIVASEEARERKKG